MNYLAVYDAASPSEKYPLVQKWMKTEPLPFFAQLRKERPILVTPECVLVTKFTDITDILKMPKIFTVDLYKPKMAVTDTDEGYLMAHDDDALHYREKSLMQGLLNREDLPHVRKVVADACKASVKQATDRDGHGHIEVVNDYCRHVPATMVQNYFGLDGGDEADLIRWSFWNQYDAFHNQPFDLNSPELSQHITEQHDKVSEELVKYIAVLIGRKLVMAKLASIRKKFRGVSYYLRLAFDFLRGTKREEPKDDVVMRLLKSSFDDDIDFGLARQGVNVGGLLIGSIETTSQAVSQTLEYFLDRPELLDKVAEAAGNKDDYLFDAMVWEALRFVPISPYMFRQASIDCTVARGTDHETRIPSGTNVLLITQSAMFDDYANSDPETFDPNRNWYHHFNFGYGSHECLGKYIGMVMIPEMVRHIVLQPGIKAQGNMDYKDGPFPEEYILAW